jgi:hypothetical protein
MNNNNHNRSSSDDVISWVIVIICLVAFWPLGLVLLLKKISFAAKSNSSGYSNFKPGRASWPSHGNQYKHNAWAKKPYQRQTAAPQEPEQQRTSYHPAPKAQQPYTPYQTAQAPWEPRVNYYAQNTQKNPALKKDTSDKKGRDVKNNGKGLAAFLTLLGIIFSVVGISCISAGIGRSVTAGMDGSALGTLLVGIFFSLGGLISFISRWNIMGRVRRCNKYWAILGDREVMTVTDMAKSAGISQKKLRKDLIELADNGHFGKSAYFDTGLDSLCLTSSAAEKARHGTSAAGEVISDKPVSSENQYVTIINELHMLCSKTIDPSICANIQRIEELTAKIFKIVEDKPEKAPQIRRFMNYYLPTTLKLLHSYETLEKQGVGGENITSAKQDIERILETLAAGFEQQLDNLFKADKIDISSDINVLENLMEQDGLTNEGNILKTAGGH